MTKQIYITPYQTKNKPLAGTSYIEVVKKAHFIFHEIEKQTKRQPYLRSAFFQKGKVFLNLFWPHLNQKPKRERLLRLKLLPCAIELIKLTRNQPSIRQNPNKKGETLYRFTGLTPEREIFRVQIKEDVKTKKKYFMSVFYEQ